MGRHSSMRGLRVVPRSLGLAAHEGQRWGDAALPLYPRAIQRGTTHCRSRSCRSDSVVLLLPGARRIVEVGHRKTRK